MNEDRRLYRARLKQRQTVIPLVVCGTVCCLLASSLAMSLLLAKRLEAFDPNIVTFCVMTLVTAVSGVGTYGVYLAADRLHRHFWPEQPEGE